jgi:hypothetical protein
VRVENEWKIIGTEKTGLSLRPRRLKCKKEKTMNNGNLESMKVGEPV